MYYIETEVNGVKSVSKDGFTTYESAELFCLGALFNSLYLPNNTKVKMRIVEPAARVV